MSWPASKSTGVIGYKVYWGTASHSYGPGFDCGNELSAHLVGKFNVGTTYYFVVTAYNSKKEGMPSIEKSCTPKWAGKHRLKIEKRKR